MQRCQKARGVCGAGRGCVGVQRGVGVKRCEMVKGMRGLREVRRVQEKLEVCEFVWEWKGERGR